MRLFHCQNDAAIDLAFFQALQHLVDFIEWLGFDDGADFAARGEVERFLHVFARSDDRAFDGYAVEHCIENRDWQLRIRQADYDERAAAANGLVRLLKRFFVTATLIAPCTPPICS